MRRHPLATTCRFDPQMTRVSKDFVQQLKSTITV
jgi:hypothetical protein